MPNLVTQLQTILEQELARHTDTTIVQARVAEGIFGFAVDHPKIEQELILEALALLSDQGREALRDAVNAAKRIFLENETLEVLTRERVLERRKPQRASAIQLAKENDLEGLRRIGARALQFGLQAAKPDVAKVIIDAWELLSQYECSHT
jgi:hypothetical protein